MLAARLSMQPPSWAAEYVGLPYKAGGRSRKTGLDCWSLLTLVWRERFFFEAPSFENVRWDKALPDASARAIVAAMNSDLARYVEVVPGQERIGDGVRLNLRGAPMHCGLIVGPFLMLHIEEGCDSCIEDLRGTRWRYESPQKLGRVAGFYRPNELTYG